MSSIIIKFEHALSILHCNLDYIIGFYEYIFKNYLEHMEKTTTYSVNNNFSFQENNVFSHIQCDNGIFVQLVCEVLKYISKWRKCKFYSTIQSHMQMATFFPNRPMDEQLEEFAIHLCSLTIKYYGVLNTYNAASSDKLLYTN